MKVYVDELPKSCDECPCFYDENISCQASDEWLPLDEEDNFSRSYQIHPKCPLNCLADYTKQVRKEVIDDVYAVLEQSVPHSFCWSWAVIKKELNKIQGEDE